MNIPTSSYQQSNIKFDKYYIGLDLMEKLKIFTKREKRKIIQRRNQYEIRLMYVSQSKDILIASLKFEMNLRADLEEKLRKKGLQQKRYGFKKSIMNRIKKLLNFTLRKYPNDYRVWTLYFKCCNQMKLKSCVRRLLDQMLELHKNVAIFKLVADWELFNCHSIERARKFIQQGLNVHEKSKLLFKEAFKLELEYAKQQCNKLKEKSEVEKTNGVSDLVLSDPKEQREKKETNEVSDLVLKGKLAEAVYDTASNKINSISFVLELLKLTELYSSLRFIPALQDKIIEDMCKKYPNDVIVWDIRARRELNRPKAGTLRQRMENCISVYKNGVKMIPTKRMWDYYLKYVTEINDDCTTLPNFRKNALMTAYNEAHDLDILSEKDYYIWIEIADTDEKPLLLRKATDKQSTSANLWSSRLLYHALRVKDENEMLTIMHKFQSISGIPNKELIWLRFIRFYHLDPETSKTEKIWREALKDPLAGGALKSFYLQWLVVTYGIQTARKAYATIGLNPPFSLQLHKIMARLEDCLSIKSRNHCRFVYETAIEQFGASNTDIWLDFIKFEEKDGNPANVQKIYSEAWNKLDKSMFDAFEREYESYKARTLPNNRDDSFSSESVIEDSDEEIMEVVGSSESSVHRISLLGKRSHFIR